jgi:hypothetical protein
LDVLLPQCDALGVELLIGDSTGKGIPADLLPSGTQLRHIVVPGASVFELRARATAEARGRIVAWTEDHCIPATDWCEKILEAHEREPDAGAVGGAVLNGSQDELMDWSNFLCTFGPFVPPMTRTPQRGPTIANISFRRDALPTGPIRDGWIETKILAALSSAGRIRFDDRLQVTHVQSHGFWQTFAAHFHNGRSTTGMLGDTLADSIRKELIAHCLVIPHELVLTAVRPLYGNRSIPWVRHLPLMYGLGVAFAAGEFVGLMTRSAGRSPQLLE